MNFNEDGCSVGKKHTTISLRVNTAFTLSLASNSPYRRLVDDPRQAAGVRTSEDSLPSTASHPSPEKCRIILSVTRAQAGLL